jgi:hypothetical protein
MTGWWNDGTTPDGWANSHRSAYRTNVRGAQVCGIRVEGNLAAWTAATAELGTAEIHYGLPLL